MKRRSTRAVGGASSSFVATASKRTLSEGWFVECARERGLSGWETHEPNLGIPTSPDFLLRVPAASTGAVCEVKEFRTSGLQRRLERPHNRVLTLSGDGVYGSIRRQVREAAKQLKPLPVAATWPSW